MPRRSEVAAVAVLTCYVLDEQHEQDIIPSTGWHPCRRAEDRTGESRINLHTTGTLRTWLGCSCGMGWWVCVTFPTEGLRQTGRQSSCQASSNDVFSPARSITNPLPSLTGEEAGLRGPE